MSIYKNIICTLFLFLLVGKAISDVFVKKNPNLGAPLSNEEVKKYDFVIMPDGQGLPDGQGSVDEGKNLYDIHCMACHGMGGVKGLNGDLAGGQVILGLRSGLSLYANVRPVKLFQGVKHKVHGIHKDIWDPNLVDMVMVRENTEGLYHALLRRMSQKAIGEKDTPMVIEKFPGLEGEVAWDPRPISRKGSERVIRFAFELAEHRQEGSARDKFES